MNKICKCLVNTCGSFRYKHDAAMEPTKTTKSQDSLVTREFRYCSIRVNQKHLHSVNWFRRQSSVKLAVWAFSLNFSHVCAKTLWMPRAMSKGLGCHYHHVYIYSSDGTSRDACISYGLLSSHCYANPSIHNPRLTKRFQLMAHVLHNQTRRLWTEWNCAACDIS